MVAVEGGSRVLQAVDGHFLDLSLLASARLTLWGPWTDAFGGYHPVMPFPRFSTAVLLPGERWEEFFDGASMVILAWRRAHWPFWYRDPWSLGSLELE